MMVRLVDERVGFELDLKGSSQEQRLAKEVVEPIPLPLLIQGHHKKIAALQFLQHLLAVSTALATTMLARIHTAAVTMLGGSRHNTIATSVSTLRPR